MAIMAPTNMQNNRGGNGRHTPLRRKNSQQRQEEELKYLGKTDTRMRFKNSKDPVYVAFDFLDKQPLGRLAADFVKDSLQEMMYFVSKVR